MLCWIIYYVIKLFLRLKENPQRTLSEIRVQVQDVEAREGEGEP